MLVSMNDSSSQKDQILRTVDSSFQYSWIPSNVRFTLTLYFHLYLTTTLFFIIKVDPNHYYLQYSYNNVCCLDLLKTLSFLL